MSENLFNNFIAKSTDFELFKKRGGVVSYEHGKLTVKAKTDDDLLYFQTKIIDQYCEKTLVCSSSQWNYLVVVNESGIRKIDELRTPFNSHPNVAIQEHPPLKLVFIGTVDAVNSAYDYFSASLNKELIVDK